MCVIEKLKHQSHLLGKKKNTTLISSSLLFLFGYVNYTPIDEKIICVITHDHIGETYHMKTCHANVSRSFHLMSTSA